MTRRVAGQYCSHHYALQLLTGGCRDIVRARADSTCRRWRKCGARIDLGETRAAGRIFLQPTQHGRVRPPCTVERVADARIGARDWDFGSCVQLHERPEIANLASGRLRSRLLSGNLLLRSPARHSAAELWHTSRVPPGPSPASFLQPHSTSLALSWRKTEAGRRPKLGNSTRQGAQLWATSNSLRKKPAEDAPEHVLQACTGPRSSLYRPA